MNLEKDFDLWCATGIYPGGWYIILGEPQICSNFGANHTHQPIHAFFLLIIIIIIIIINVSSIPGKHEAKELQKTATLGPESADVKLH
jgi:hypothetical protein